MSLNDADLVRLKVLFKRYEDTISTMLNDHTRTAGQIVYEHEQLMAKLKVFRKKFAQTERAIGNAMHTRPRQQIGAFGPSQARSRMVHLKAAKASAEKLIKRVAGLLDIAPMGIDFRHKGIVDIANKIEKQFTEIGDAHNPLLNDGPTVSAMTPQAGGWTLMFHVLILMLELTRVGVEGGVFTRRR